MTCVSGTSELDGPVDVLVVTEEAGTGLGARVAGTRAHDPGDEIGERPADGPGSGSTASRCTLWPVSTSESRRRVGPLGARGGGRPGAGCGWCCARPRRCCCSATTGSCATSRVWARSWSSSRSAVRPRLVSRSAYSRRWPTGVGVRSRLAGVRIDLHTHSRASDGTDARPSWCTRRWRPGSTSSRSPTTTRPRAGPRRPRRPTRSASSWCAAWRSAPGTGGAGCTCWPTCRTRPTRRSSSELGRIAGRPRAPGCRRCSSGSASSASPVTADDVRRAAPGPPRPAARTSPTRW